MKPDVIVLGSTKLDLEYITSQLPRAKTIPILSKFLSKLVWKHILSVVTTDEFYIINECLLDISGMTFDCVLPTDEFVGMYGTDISIRVFKRKYAKYAKPIEEDFENGNIPTYDLVSPPFSYPTHDIFFLSYDEPYADTHYNLLKSRFPKAKRVHGVKGIFDAHKKIAELSKSPMFFVVDADALVCEDFDFAFRPFYQERDRVYVWRSINPVNMLEYGYGGVKMFSKKHVLNMTDWQIDFTGSSADVFQPMDAVSNITAFDVSELITYRSAFRECAKLAYKKPAHYEEDSIRLQQWCEHSIHGNYHKYATDGAKDGKRFGNLCLQNQEDINKINDFEWLTEKFNAKYNL